MLSDDPDRTLPVEAPQPSELLRDNAGYLFGRMLDDLSESQEAEGDLIGPYLLCELLGEGGFGMVWRAEQSEPVRREVALKVIKPGMHSVQVLERFNRERQALASLDHPGISRLLDAGVTRDGRPWFAMELVRGSLITTWCHEQHATLEQRLHLFREVCKAVQHAHEKGVLHRDLKPTNILVTLVDGAPVPKVIDFGMAKALLPTTGLGGMMMTQADQVLGTPLYMSPEQVTGASELDARTDVYALGVLLYEMLTGVPPYDITVFRSRDLEVMMQHILETHPERPSTLVRRRAKTGEKGQGPPVKKTQAPSLPADLDWIALRALAKSRELRYQTAQEFANDVQRHLDHQPVQARPPGLTYAASRWLRRHRAGVVAAVASSVLSVLLIVGVLLWQQLNPPDSVVKLAAAGGFTNGLGMRFVPVPITGGPTGGQPVLFCIWETRVQDYDIFAKETKRRWTRPDFEQDPLHPAVFISWEDATAFCQWLTVRERRAGRIARTDTYRLPSDHEWSCALGIDNLEDSALPPHSKNSKIALGYPWGKVWPPPNDAGNYRSDELLALHSAGVAKLPKTEVTSRWDGFGATAPVGSYAPSRLGLYDLGGNAWEWCEDWFDGEQQKRLLRGGSWTDMSTYFLQSSCRHAINPKALNQAHGFRVVLASEGASAAPSAAVVPPPPPVETVLTNSLGMKFVAVPVTGGPTKGKDVLFSIWETRVQDYSAFAKETRRDWPEPDFEQGPTHPAVNVSWADATAFCSWLTGREHTAGTLPPRQSYRLPGDHEWSCAIGLGGEEDATQPPQEKSMGLGDQYEWGSAWPPPDNAGNFMSQELQGAFRDGVWKTVAAGTSRPPTRVSFFNFPPESLMSFRDRRDGHATTAPVGSFPANRLGLHDLGGNVWEWCEDLFQTRPPRDWRVWRGASFASAKSSSLASSSRDGKEPGYCRFDAGFRVVLSETSIPPDAEKTRLARAPLDTATKETPFANSLGMKFVPVPGTDVLFCIHETRYQDFAAYFAEAPSARSSWNDPGDPGYDVPLQERAWHPVNRVNWEEAQSFCQWLSSKEGRTYRLPSDHEWSYAVGIGGAEKRTPETTAATASQVPDAYPWGSAWPPPAGAGNYADEAWRRAHPTLVDSWLKDYDDGHALTAPVMSFLPNEFGLYDLGGNVGEWVQDWKDPTRKARVLRGNLWWTWPGADLRKELLSSARVARAYPATIKHPCYGFRCVLEKLPSFVRPVFTPPALSRQGVDILPASSATKTPASR